MSIRRSGWARRSGRSKTGSASTGSAGSRRRSTADPPEHSGGDAVPPGAAVPCCGRRRTSVATSWCLREFQEAATGGVHGEHDVVVRRPLPWDEPLFTWVEGWGARPAGANSVVTLQLRHQGRRWHGRRRAVVEHGLARRHLSSRWRRRTGACLSRAARNHPIGSWAWTSTRAWRSGMPRYPGTGAPITSKRRPPGGAARIAHSSMDSAPWRCARRCVVDGRLRTGTAGALERIAVRFARPMPLGSRSGGPALSGRTQGAGLRSAVRATGRSCRTAERACPDPGPTASPPRRSCAGRLPDQDASPCTRRSRLSTLPDGFRGARRER